MPRNERHIAWVGVVNARLGLGSEPGKPPPPEGQTAVRNAAQAFAEMRATPGWALLTELIRDAEGALVRGLEPIGDPPRILEREQYSQSMAIREGLMRARELPAVVEGIAATVDRRVADEVRSREERSRQTGGADGSGTGTGISSG